MLRKLVYKGNQKIRLIHPIDLEVVEGTEVTVDNKEHAQQLIEKGFVEVAEGKKEIQKKEGEK